MHLDILFTNITQVIQIFNTCIDTYNGRFPKYTYNLQKDGANENFSFIEIKSVTYIYFFELII